MWWLIHLALKQQKNVSSRIEFKVLCHIMRWPPLHYPFSYLFTRTFHEIWNVFEVKDVCLKVKFNLIKLSTFRSGCQQSWNIISSSRRGNKTLENRAGQFGGFKDDWYASNSTWGGTAEGWQWKTQSEPG